MKFLYLKLRSEYPELTDELKSGYQFKSLSNVYYE